ncbi:hypothetical protein CN645_29985 [Burkholderia sp. IDO3]|nr:hypothetical protein DCN14_02135 [Burkholderia sp. IDO3]PCD58122.1 hypothetical protein CN645_29985 [Burkholderia sp. IDO3]
MPDAGVPAAPGTPQRACAGRGHRAAHCGGATRERGCASRRRPPRRIRDRIRMLAESIRLD